MSNARKFVTVFTGAGVSADSGVATFRDKDGLWEGHKVEHVATPSAFRTNPQLVWDFYRARYQQLKEVQPNAAHYAIADLERRLEEAGQKFLLITQNVDGLHTRAGSKNVIELHGDLRTLKCSYNQCDFTSEDEVFWNSETVPICPVCDHSLRVNVVWFGEMLPEQKFILAEDAAYASTHMLVVGTSGVVQPAVSLVSVATFNNAKIVECNPTPAFFETTYLPGGYRCFRGNASVTVPEAVKFILSC